MKSGSRQNMKGVVGKKALPESSVTEQIIALFSENVSYTVLCCMTALLSILFTTLLLIKLAKKKKLDEDEKKPGLKSCDLRKDVDLKNSDDEETVESQVKDENSEEDLPWLLQKPSVVMLNHEGEECNDGCDDNIVICEEKPKNDNKRGNTVAGGDTGASKDEESDQW